MTILKKHKKKEWKKKRKPYTQNFKYCIIIHITSSLLISHSYNKVTKWLKSFILMKKKCNCSLRSTCCATKQVWCIQHIKLYLKLKFYLYWDSDIDLKQSILGYQVIRLEKLPPDFCPPIGQISVQKLKKRISILTLPKKWRRCVP